MAETSFKGLTIEIGADTTKLSQALAQADKGIKDTQRQLRKLKSALEADPSSMRGVAVQFATVSEKAALAAGKVKTLERYIEKAGRETSNAFGGQTFGSLSASTQNARLEAARLVDELNAVNSGIRAVKQNIAKKHGYAGAKNMTGGQLKAVIEELRELGKVSDEDEASLARLRDEQTRLDAAVNDMQAVSRIRDAKVEVQSQQAEVKRLASRWVECSKALAKARSEASRFSEAKAEADALGDALKNAATHADRLSLAERRVDALKEAMESLSEEADAVRGAGMSELVLQTRRAAEEAAKAQEEYAGMEGALSDLRRRAAELKANIEAALTGGNSADSMRAELSRVESQIGQTEASLSGLRQRAEAADRSFARHAMRTELKQMQAEAAETTTKMLRLRMAANGMGRPFESSAYTVRSLGTALMGLSTFASGTVLYGIVNSADQIDSAYRDMRKTVEGTEEQFEALKDSAIDFSRTHVTSADQMLEIQAMGGQLGIAVDDLDEFAETVSNIEVATNIDANTAAEQLGKLSGVLDMSSEDFGHFSDSLVRLGNNFPGMESDIMEITTRFGGMGAIVGMSADEMLAWSTAATATGQKSEAAGSAMQRFIGKVEGAVAKGGDSLEQFAEVSGMSAEKFADVWEDSPSDALQAFVEGLHAIDEAGGSVDATLQDMGITNVRDRQLLEGLAQTTDILSDALGQSADAWRDGGDAAAEADKKAQGFSGQLSMLKNNLQVLGAEVGESFAPVLGVLNQMVQGVTEWYTGLSDGAKTAIDVGGLIAAGLGPVLSVGGAIGQGFAHFRQSVNESAAATLKLMDSSSGTAKALQGVTDAATLSAAASGMLEDDATKAARGLQRQAAIAKVAGVAMGVAKAAAVGLAVAGIALLADALVKAYRENKTFEDSMESMSSEAQRTSSIVDGQTASMEELDTRTGQAAKTWSEFVEAQSQRAQAMRQNNDDLAAEVSTLDLAKSAIEQYAGKTGLSVQAQGRLRQAVALVNDACGTQYKVVDAANGVISDSTGEYDENTDSVKENKDAILDNIEARKKEAEQEVLTENYKQAVQERIDAETQLADAVRRRDEAQKAYDSAPSGDKASAYTELVDAKEDVKKYSEAAENAISLQKSFEKQFESLGDTASEAGSKLLDAMGDFSGVFTSGLSLKGFSIGEFQEMLSKSGASISDFKGLTEEQLASIAGNFNGTAEDINWSFASILSNGDQTMTQLGYDLMNAGVKFGTLKSIGSENLQALAESCNYNVGAMLFYIQHYNDTPILDKNGKVTVSKTSLVDAQGNVYTWNGTTLLDKDGQAVVNDVSLTDAYGNMVVWNGTELKRKDSTADVNDQSVIDAIKQRKNWNNGEYEDKEAHVSIFRKITDFFTGGQATGGLAYNGHPRRFASGGIVDSRMSSIGNGFIASRPTLIDGGSRLVGEAGAEAIIPLDNRRYVRPFASAVASMVEPSGGSVTYNLSIDGAKVNDDPAIRSAFLNLMFELKRKAEMNVG